MVLDVLPQGVELLPPLALLTDPLRSARCNSGSWPLESVETRNQIQARLACALFTYADPLGSRGLMLRSCWRAYPSSYGGGGCWVRPCGAVGARMMHVSIYWSQPFGKSCYLCQSS